MAAPHRPGVQIAAEPGCQWWPSFLVEEVMPEGRATPEAWLRRLNDGAHVCGLVSSDPQESLLLTEGAVVPFTAERELGTVVLTFDAAGEPQFEPRPPAGACLWVDRDPDTVCDTPEQMVERMREAGEDSPGCRHEVEAFSVGEDVGLVFTASGGPPRFLTLPLAVGPVEGVA